MWNEERDGWIRTEKKKELVLGWRVEKGRMAEKNLSKDWMLGRMLDWQPGNNPKVGQDRIIGVKNIDNQTDFD